MSNVNEPNAFHEIDSTLADKLAALAIETPDAVQKILSEGVQHLQSPAGKLFPAGCPTPGPTTFKLPYAGWAPFCLLCGSMARMCNRPFGWHCDGCGNDIDFNLEHYPKQQPTFNTLKP